MLINTATYYIEQYGQDRFALVVRGYPNVAAMFNKDFGHYSPSTTFQNDDEVLFILTWEQLKQRKLVGGTNLPTKPDYSAKSDIE